MCNAAGTSAFTNPGTGLTPRTRTDHVTWATDCLVPAVQDDCGTMGEGYKGTPHYNNIKSASAPHLAPGLIDPKPSFPLPPRIVLGGLRAWAASGPQHGTLYHVMTEVKKDSKPMGMSQGQGKELLLAKHRAQRTKPSKLSMWA